MTVLGEDGFQVEVGCGDEGWGVGEEVLGPGWVEDGSQGVCVVLLGHGLVLDFHRHLLVVFFFFALVYKLRLKRLKR